MYWIATSYQSGKSDTHIQCRPLQEAKGYFNFESFHVVVRVHKEYRVVYSVLRTPYAVWISAVYDRSRHNKRTKTGASRN